MITTPVDVATFLGLPAGPLNNLAAQCQQLAEQHVKDHLGTQGIEQDTYVEYYPQQHQQSVQEGDPHYILNRSGTMAVPAYFLAQNLIQLRQFAVRSITEAREDASGFFGQVAGSFGANTILTSGNDYFLHLEQATLAGGQPISWSGLMERRAFWWPSVAGSLKITYVAGLTAAELNGRWSVFKTACLEEIADLYIRALTIAGGQHADLESQTLGGGASTAFLDNHESGLPVCDKAAAILQPWIGYAEMAL
jgi:hypothetical protein